jgi:hypothetical protein
LAAPRHPLVLPAQNELVEAADREVTSSLLGFPGLPQKVFPKQQSA